MQADDGKDRLGLTAWVVVVAPVILRTTKEEIKLKQPLKIARRKYENFFLYEFTTMPFPVGEKVPLFANVK